MKKQWWSEDISSNDSGVKRTLRAARSLSGVKAIGNGASEHGGTSIATATTTATKSGSTETGALVPSRRLAEESQAGTTTIRRNSRRRLTKNPIKDESNQTKGEGETRVNAKDSHQVRHVILRRVLHDRIRSQRAQKFQPALSAGFFGVAKFVP